MSERRVENGKDPGAPYFKTIIKEFWTSVTLSID